MKSKKEEILHELDGRIERVNEFIEKWQELMTIVAETSHKGYSNELEAQYYVLKIWLMEHYTFRRQMLAPGSRDLVWTCLGDATTLSSIFSSSIGTYLRRFTRLHNQALLGLVNYLGVLKQRHQEVNESSEDEFVRTIVGTKTSIFIGHSFAKEDSSVVTTILKAIGLLGVNVVTGEKPKAESISEKIKGKIAECDPIIVIMTKRTKIEGGGYNTSGWLIQEAAYALGKNKKIILLVENDVTNYGGLQGDLEELRFDRNTFLEVILPLQEIVQEAISSSE